ncbi:hypothetical protein ACIQMV_39330 [Streptomyces sp. NPDC091412]|uniref:hypothetical protein n=1 Tax=Streptomyces sp. NPDC091412 TaxID=3366002 RepID=UPI0037F2FB99
MAEHLGPLELVGDRWIIGDPKREGGSWLVLTAEGMTHHEPGSPEPLTVLPWSKFVELQIHTAYNAWHTTRTMGVLGFGRSLPTGPSSCSVRGTLRHPYEHCSMNYTHHKRPYTASHVYAVEALFRRTSEARALHRLGDPEWLGAAVARLAPLSPWRAHSRNHPVREIFEDLGI